MEPTNAADRKSIRRAEKAARLADVQRREVIGQIMSTAPGRSWLWDRLSACNIFSTTHIVGSPDASAFQEGRRSVGLDLLADIMAHCPDQFIQAMREANERHNSNDASTARNPDSDSNAERRGSTLLDGGDSGAEPDNDADSAPSYANPGADIYITNSGIEAR